MSNNSTLVAASRAAARSLAGRDTPFLHDCWYVAGFSEEFAQDRLLSRRILGKPLVLYRSSEGMPVALDDRCPHRSFPLSKGRLEQDTIICGYHGLRYGSSGRCIAIPGQAAEPKGIAVRRYTTRETGPIVWIWMGAAPPGPLPSGLDWLCDERGWPSSRGYFHLPANYISLHENLLDLTHLSFLHAGSFGTPDYALAPYSVNLDESSGQFEINRSVVPTRLPPVWAQPTGLSGSNAARIASSKFRSPGLHVVDVSFYDSDLSEQERVVFRIATAHMVTPETAHTTHYFIHHGRDFALEDPDVTRYMHEQLFVAFKEDVDGLTAVEDSVSSVPAEDFYEFSIASDRAGVAMRRWLLQAVGGTPVRVAPDPAPPAASDKPC